MKHEIDLHEAFVGRYEHVVPILQLELVCLATRGLNRESRRLLGLA